MFSQSKLEVKRIIYKCGYFGHHKPVENSLFEFIVELDNEACQNILRYGSYEYLGMFPTTYIKANDTSHHSFNFAGSAEGNSCNGGHYNDRYGNYNDVVEQGSLKFTTLNIDL